MWIIHRPRGRQYRRDIGVEASRPVQGKRSRPVPLSSELGTHKTVKARFWPLLSGKKLHHFKLFPLRSAAEYGDRFTSRPGQYMDTSLIRNCLLLGPYSRTMSRALGWSWGGVQFLMSEVPLYGGQVTWPVLGTLQRYSTKRDPGSTRHCKTPHFKSDM